MMPLIRVELDYIKHGVNQAIAHHLNGTQEMIEKSINEQITEEWVQEKIDNEVRNIINEAIEGVAKDPQLRRAISDLVARQIESLIVTA